VLKAGLTAVSDADLKGYFDTIPHHQLMACVERRIADGAVLKLIRQWLRVPIREEPSDRHQLPRKVKRRVGIPKGGVMSPLLANLTSVRGNWFFHLVTTCKIKQSCRF